MLSLIYITQTFTNCSLLQYFMDVTVGCSFTSSCAGQLNNVVSVSVLVYLCAGNGM